jgi:hypothetical protein
MKYVFEIEECTPENLAPAGFVKEFNTDQEAIFFAKTIDPIFYVWENTPNGIPPRHVWRPETKTTFDKDEELKKFQATLNSQASKKFYEQLSNE